MLKHWERMDKSVVDFLREGLARIHCIVRIPQGMQLAMNDNQVEERLIEITRSWSDQLGEVLRKTSDQNDECEEMGVSRMVLLHYRSFAYTRTN